MTENATAESCARSCGKRRALYGCFVISILLIYIAAEWGLRQVVYAQPEITSSSDWQPIVDRLPLMLREPLQRHLTAVDLEQKLPLEKDPAARLKMLYELAPLYDGRKRQQVFERIISDPELRYMPQAVMAWTTMITDYDLPQPVDSYLTFLENVTASEVEQRVNLWASGWFALSRSDAPEMYRYLREMADRRIISGSLVDAYEELEDLAIRNDDDELYELARELVEPCRMMRLEEMQGMPSNGR